MRKIFMAAVLTVGLAICLGQNVSAKQAFISTTTQDNIQKQAEHARTYLSNLGYSIDYYTTASEHVIRDRLGVNVSFYSGHGNYQLIDTGSSGVFYRNYDATVSDGRRFVGIGTKNLSNARLIVFSGCQTSNNSMGEWPLARMAADTYGATSSVGWTTDVAIVSQNSYIKNFMNGLSQGKGIQAAIDYANGFSYLDNRVKNSYAWGNTGVSITTSSYALRPLSLDSISEHEPIAYSIDQESIPYTTNFDTNDFISEYIQTYINDRFDIDDYIIETSSTNNEYVSLTYAPGGVRTNNVYTASINEKGVYQIQDYTKSGFDNEKDFIVRVKRLSVQEEDAFINNNATESENFQVYQRGYYFDDLSKELYFYVTIDYAYENGTFGSQIYTKEVK